MDSSKQQGLTFCSFFFYLLQTVAKEHAPSSGEYFKLLSRLVISSHSGSQCTHPPRTWVEGSKWLNCLSVACMSVYICAPLRLLSHAHQTGITIQGVQKLLEVELKWLRKVRVRVTALSLSLTKYVYSLGQHLVTCTHTSLAYIWLHACYIQWTITCLVINYTAPWIIWTALFCFSNYAHIAHAWAPRLIIFVSISSRK